MKTRNIITIISIIFAMVSCSTENDILNDINNNNSNATVEDAVISCSINNVATKALDNTDEATIKNACFFLLDAKGDVLGYRTGKETVTFKTKKEEGMKVLAVANISDATMATLSTLASKAAIKAVVLNANDLNELPKMGEATATTNTEITVNQIAARIDLQKVTVNSLTNANSVTLTKVELVNQVNQIKLNESEAHVNSELVNAGIGVTELPAEDTATLYTFANNGADATALRLTFTTDGGKVLTTDVTIKHDGAVKVVAGYNYKLNISVNITGNNIDPTVTFTVADWNDSSFSVDMK